MDLKKIIKRGDIILFILIMLSSLSVFLFFFGRLHASGSPLAGNTVIITKNGSEFMRCDLSEDRTIDMGTNIIAIEDGSVYMKSAECKNLICVKTGRISSPGQSIVCLPNRITVTITGKEDEPDAVTK